MRRAFLVCYDIRHPRRLHWVYRTMRGYGRHLQLSVFSCELSDTERARMVADLGKIIHHGEDQVLTIDLGPGPAPLAENISALGVPYSAPERGPLVV
jgi:CRISPR-associated protein Cas2